jgi:hypothetical protein
MTPRLWPLVLTAGVLGYLTGAWQQATWQDVIEPAQVIAGLVHYPADNPVYLYSTLTWTALHQIVAGLLALGISEVDLTVVISGVIGALSFVALGLATRACGAPMLVSATAPLLIYLSGVARLTPGYPVLLLGWPYTYGLIAHGVALAVLALVALRRDRVAAVLLGLFPAVHPGMGGLVTLVLAGTLMLRSPLRVRAGRVWPWWSAGLVLTLMSAAVHWGVFVPDTSHLARSPELEQSLRLYWDGHRQPLAYLTVDVLVALGVPIVMLLWRRDTPATDTDEPGRMLGLMLLIAVATAVAADVVLRVTSGSFAQMVSMPMPTRLLVLPVLAAPAWFIGIATRSATPDHVRAILQALLLGLAVLVCPIVGMAEYVDVLNSTWIGWIATTRASVAQAVLTVLLAGLVATFLLPKRLARWLSGAPLTAVQATFMVALVVLSTLHVVQAWRDHADEPVVIADRSNNVVLGAAAAGSGLLVTDAELHLMQAATRRPLLIDPGALDGLPYVPIAARATDEILRELYRITIAGPPDGDLGAIGVVPEDADDNWGNRTPERWRALSDRFGFTDILTTTELTLQLHEVARDNELVLWRIPRPTGPPHP